VLAPLLSNLVLAELDRELERRGRRFVRYADDGIENENPLQWVHRLCRIPNPWSRGGAVRAT